VPERVAAMEARPANKSFFLNPDNQRSLTAQTG
jgi:hypothetical protein